MEGYELEGECLVLVSCYDPKDFRILVEVKCDFEEEADIFFLEVVAKAPNGEVMIRNFDPCQLSCTEESFGKYDYLSFSLTEMSEEGREISSGIDPKNAAQRIVNWYDREICDFIVKFAQAYGYNAILPPFLVNRRFQLGEKFIPCLKIRKKKNTHAPEE